jgi:hypothetical protein
MLLNAAEIGFWCGWGILTTLLGRVGEAVHQVAKRLAGLKVCVRGWLIQVGFVLLNAAEVEFWCGWGILTALLGRVGEAVHQVAKRLAGLKVRVVLEDSALQAACWQPDATVA